MTAYIANHQKKKKILQKREQELRHAIKHKFNTDKIKNSAEKVREAKLNAFKSDFSKNSVLPASSYKPGDEAIKWKSYLTDEIIKIYSA